MKIYTKSGDKGTTSLFTGQRVPKNDPIIEALGTIDECNSTIGIALSHLSTDGSFAPVREELETIQHALFDVGAAIATPRTRAELDKINKTRFNQEATKTLEDWIDAMELQLPDLDTFLLPGGHRSGAALHQARSICRRAERLVSPLNEHADVSDNVLIYMNRLSDYLFVAARYVNSLTNVTETLWEHHKH